MEFAYQLKQGVLVVTLHGSFTYRETASTRQRFKQLIEQESAQVLIDLSRLNYIDARGLSVFITALHYARQQEGVVHLLNPTANVQAMLELTRLQHIFKIYGDELVALHDLRQRKH